MSISISSQVLGTLSVTIAETTGTLSVAVLATAPAVLSVELGTPGPAATVTVGTTTTLSAGSSATVTNSGSSLAAVLNFGIPQGIQGQQGIQGIQGEQGIQGNPGAAATITVGSTTTGSAGTSATVTNSGTSSAAILDFTIPRGDTGATGPAGSAGVGVPVGGTAGQSLLKVDGTDYNTTWGTPALADHSYTTQATVRNNTGSTLTPGQIVYINGATGNRPTVALSKADAESTSAGTYAMVEASIANNTDGTVITAGTVSNLDTSALADGDKLYLSPSTAGGWTTTKPSAPNHLVYIGTVTRSHPTLGTVQLRIQNGYELEELHNVAISSVANGDLLVYESSTTLWKNKSVATLGLLTTASAAATYAPLASPSLTGTPLSTTAAADTNTTQIATTAFVVGQASATTPAMNGTATIGTSLKYARADHIHPTDTSRAPLASPAFTGTPSLPTGTTAVTQTAGDNSTKLATTAFVTTAVSGAGGGGTNVQVFGGPASSGSFTWTKPANAKMVEFWLMGSGGGGGSGARYATSSARAGGAGGSAGGWLIGKIEAAALGSTATVVVGAGGAGGTAVSVDTTNGNIGTNGASTTFAGYQTSIGLGGNPGTTTTAATVAGGGSALFGIVTATALGSFASGAGNTTTGGAAATSGIGALFYPGTGGGGGAGQAAATTTATAGGLGGNKVATATNASGLTSAIAGGSGGTVGGVSPTAGTSNNGYSGGTGGGGGAYRTGVAGMAGAAGGWPGAGGGGGSASDNGFASGAGGAGANGVAIIITYF